MDCENSLFSGETCFRILRSSMPPMDSHLQPSPRQPGLKAPINPPQAMQTSQNQFRYVLLTDMLHTTPEWPSVNCPRVLLLLMYVPCIIPCMPSKKPNSQSLSPCRYLDQVLPREVDDLSQGSVDSVVWEVRSPPKNGLKWPQVLPLPLLILLGIRVACKQQPRKVFIRE